jgi:hypothetical protein
VEIKPYQGEIDSIKLNQWLQKLVFYFSVHNIAEEKNISFTWMKLEGHVQTWWESDAKTLRLEGDSLVTKWEVFKTLIKSQFYPIEYEKEQWICWHCFQQK